VVGELTAPKSAPSHSFWRVSTVLSGRAVPVCWKVSKPTERFVKENLRFVEDERASSIRLPAWIWCEMSTGCLVVLQCSLPDGLKECAIAYRDDLFPNAVPRDKACRSLAQLVSGHQTQQF